MRPSKPDRIDPQGPPGVRPPVPEPFVPEPPETEPLRPDIDEPARCPEEVPCPERLRLLSRLSGGLHD